MPSSPLGQVLALRHISPRGSRRPTFGTRAAERLVMNIDCDASEVGLARCHEGGGDATLTIKPTPRFNMATI